MSIPSLDLIQKGDWVICSRGRITRVFRGLTLEDKPIFDEKEDKSFVGALIQVQAISAPFFMGTLHSIGTEKTLPVLVHFSREEGEWEKPSKKFVRTYLATKRGRKITRKVRNAEKLPTGDIPFTADRII